ncbi:virus tail fibre assembly protein, lambda gpK [Pseudomonas saponiphila]|uniref:Virus tail fibre assembly protein, lambda gpK n=1 Tax=Pseudomonas saponiphila TaxID=556534 RepID=A0A1H4Y569_9PSED|nr:tail fiber assembly protein [Pseudomonas saponiphila]SED12291.1 virus tail fibre assembly protein, lambda gpK [Pseudomonas saponiphila]
MSGFAVRNDRASWRAVDRPDQLDADEYYCAENPPDPVPQLGELATLAIEQRDRLLAAAANRMGPLQDAVEAGQATEDEVARLQQWKTYRIDLNRIEQQEGYPAAIRWPTSPDQTE